MVVSIGTHVSTRSSFRHDSRIMLMRGNIKYLSLILNVKKEENNLFGTDSYFCFKLLCTPSPPTEDIGIYAEVFSSMKCGHFAPSAELSSSCSSLHDLLQLLNSELFHYEFGVN